MKNFDKQIKMLSEKGYRITWPNPVSKNRVYRKGFMLAEILKNGSVVYRAIDRSMF